jgi:hypothetical protein
VHGPILVHERIDLGFAVLCTVMANLWSKKTYKPTDFLPSYYPKARHDPTEGFERLLAMADAANGDNRNARR